ncbi:MAG: hypothetical protein LBQ23_03055 [Puniceicoccales bacterium]|jgi:hypothetical protein|nr:hypothetical protein [Puniceicoccales bacterium]
MTPTDFSLDKIFLKKCCEDYQSWKEIVASSNFDSTDKYEGIEIIDTEYSITIGDNIIEFEFSPGDICFIDKISYHFQSSKMGESIVFTTNAIETFTRAPKFSLSD